MGSPLRAMVFWPTTAAATRGTYMQSFWFISTGPAGVGASGAPLVTCTQTTATLPSGAAAGGGGGGGDAATGGAAVGTEGAGRSPRSAQIRIATATTAAAITQLRRRIHHPRFQ